MDKENGRAKARKLDDKYSVPFYACDYFSKDLLPTSIRALSRKVRQDVPMRQHDDIVFLLVTQGTGLMTVNSVEYSLKRGSIFVLGPFHNYSIRPDKDSELELYECHINSGAYLYIIACPYYRMSHMTLPRPPEFFEFNERETERTENVMGEIIENNVPDDYRRAQTSFVLVLKLYGIIRAKYSENKADQETNI